MVFSDKDLGMDRGIARRDFLGGVAAVAGTQLAGGLSTASAATLPTDYYPPSRTGLRGSHPGSFEVAHQLRDAEAWDNLHKSSIGLNETYDLIVVGGGISGLAAAYFYRQKHGPSARILILDNHDDFGGHAKRNEFIHNGRTFIGYGGAEQIYRGPWEYSPTALNLIKSIGVDTNRFYTAFDWTRYQRLQLQEGVFFDKETFGRDHLAVGEGQMPMDDFLAAAPLGELAKKQIASLYANDTDYLEGKTKAEKLGILSRLTYSDFLLKIAKVDWQVLAYLRSRTDRDTRSTDSLPVLQAYKYYDMPGIAGLGLPREEGYQKRDPEEIFHFPDGNAGISRLLIRALIPDALPGSNQEDQVTARLNYAALDRPSSRVRVRLSSIGVHVRNIGPPEIAKEVEVTYVCGGTAYRVRAGNAVLAGYNALIPMMCPELPASQKAALAHAVKDPLIYTNVLVANWRPWQKLGVHFIHSLSGYYHETKLDFPVDMGSYRSSSSPDEPIILHLEKRYWDDRERPWENPTYIPNADRNKAARAQILATPWDEMEREVRTSLARMLSPGGFDPASDILAITVNRWPHGYAPGRDEFADPNWPNGQEPWVVGRQRYGRIAIANSDAAGEALTQAAIDMADRAINDLSAAA